MAEVKMPSREKEYKGHQLVGLHLPSDNNLRAYNKLAYKSGWDEEISDQAEELELLRKNNSDLKRRLKKALMDIGHKEESFAVIELSREKFATQLLCHNYRQKFQQFRNNSRNLQRNLNTCRDDLLLSDIQIDIKWGKWKNRSRNSEQIITNLNQNIFNLQQQILALHNNPQNMAATVIECSNIIAPSLANILEYIGQEHPDAWYERITKLFLHPTIAGNVNFTDAHKVSVLSSKMADPYHPVPAQNNYVNPAVNIDTPDRFNAWLHSKYAEENVGAPEKGVVPKNWLSPYNKDLVNDSEIGEGKYILGEKLLQTLMPKKNYVVHYRALQLYISLGIKVTKIYEALKFRQSPWMKPYIEENIRKRKIAKASEDEFGVMYYKLKNNAIFGKQMENVRKHMSRI
ncbi:10790_t:CDS:2 [Entrophospora sp. SA101]|nr:10790_t:CDS:2 [Entrophospora sp. SA101]